MEDLQVSNEFIVKSSLHNYGVRFVSDFTYSLKEHVEPQDIIIFDEKVYYLYKESFKTFIEKYNYILLKATENQKSYLEIAPIIESLINKKFKKNNKIIAIGGGITQDVAAFIASNIYRGVDWIFYPTTLLAQCDSCIGGKSSINFGKYKNQLGNFYPPNEIFIDLNFLDTLNELDIRSGLGEMMHFYLISGREDFIRMQTEYMLSLTDKNILKGLIHRSLEIKKKTIEIDEFDQNERQIFNYGHSFGHAIESITEYRVPHGIAVSHGMDIANFLSQKLGFVNERFRLEAKDVLQLNWKKNELGKIDINIFLDALRKDKKNVGNEVRVILTRGFGKMFKTRIDIDGEARGWIESYFDNEVY